MDDWREREYIHIYPRPSLSWCEHILLSYLPKEFTVADLKDNITKHLRDATNSPNLAVEIKSIHLYVRVSGDRHDLQLQEALQDNALLQALFDQCDEERRFGRKMAEIEFVKTPVPPPSEYDSFNLACSNNLLMWLGKALAQEQAAQSLRARDDRRLHEGGSTFEELPHELLTVCFEYLNYVDLARMQQTNKGIYRLIQAMGPTDSGRNLYELKLLARSVRYLAAFRKHHWGDGICSGTNTTATWTFTLGLIDNDFLACLDNDDMTSWRSRRPKQRKTVDDNGRKIPPQYAMLVVEGNFDGYTHDEWGMRMCGEEVIAGEKDAVDETRPYVERLNKQRFYYCFEEMNDSQECGRIDWAAVESWRERTMSHLYEELGLSLPGKKKKGGLSNELFMRCMMVCGTAREEWDSFFPSWYIQEERLEEFELRKAERSKKSKWPIAWL